MPRKAWIIHLPTRTMASKAARRASHCISDASPLHVKTCPSHRPLIQHTCFALGKLYNIINHIVCFYHWKNAGNPSDSKLPTDDLYSPLWCFVQGTCRTFSYRTNAIITGTPTPSVFNREAGKLTPPARYSLVARRPDGEGKGLGRHDACTLPGRYLLVPVELPGADNFQHVHVPAHFRCKRIERSRQTHTLDSGLIKELMAGRL